MRQHFLCYVKLHFLFICETYAMHTLQKFMLLMCYAQDAQPTATITSTMDRQRPRVPAKDTGSSLWPVPRPIRGRLQDLLAVAFVDAHWRNFWWIYYEPSEFYFLLFEWYFLASMNSMDSYIFSNPIWSHTYCYITDDVKKLSSVKVSNLLYLLHFSLNCLRAHSHKGLVPYPSMV